MRWLPPPPTTAFGALLGHITGGHLARRTPAPRTFQPMNVNFGLFPPIERMPKGRGRQAPARTDEGDGEEEGADRPGPRRAVGVAFGRGAARRG